MGHARGTAAGARGHGGKLCLAVVFVVQPYSHPIPGLSRELAAAVDVAAAAAVILAATVLVDMDLAVAAVLTMVMEATKACVSV